MNFPQIPPITSAQANPPMSDGFESNYPVLPIFNLQKCNSTSPSIAGQDSIRIPKEKLDEICANLKSKKLKDLRERCKKMRISSSGKKEEVIQRLSECILKSEIMIQIPPNQISPLYTLSFSFIDTINTKPFQKHPLLIRKFNAFARQTLEILQPTCP